MRPKVTKFWYQKIPLRTFVWHLKSFNHLHMLLKNPEEETNKEISWLLGLLMFPSCVQQGLLLDHEVLCMQTMSTFSSIAWFGKVAFVSPYVPGVVQQPISV